LKAKLEPVGVIGLDVGTEIRSNLYSDTSIGANFRFQFLQKGPFALGLNTYLGGGGGPRSRNEFTWELGLPITLIAGDLVKLTARPYLLVYTDRNCPAFDDIVALKTTSKDSLIALGDPIKGAEHPGDQCVGRGDPIHANPIYAAAGYNPSSNTFSGDTYHQAGGTAVDSRFITIDGTGVLERFTGARFMLQAVVELALSHNANLFLLLEGAPLQKQRQMLTDKFNRFYPTEDIGVYGRAGFSLKY